MDSSIQITLKSGSNLEFIRIRPKIINPGYTITYSKNAIVWISEMKSPAVTSYMNDLFTLLPLSNYINHDVICEIPGFPEMKIKAQQLDERIIDSIIARMLCYMSTYWSVFKQ